MGGIVLWGSSLGVRKKGRVTTAIDPLSGTNYSTYGHHIERVAEICDKALESEVSLLPLLCLPQPEPSFELVYVLPSQFNTRLKRSAALLFVIHPKG